MSPEDPMREALALARANIVEGGRPFGAVVVKDGLIVGRGVNEIHRTQDPTAHAELTALRAASQALGTPRLEGCVVYASGHPCPMCLGAMFMSGVGHAFFAYSNADAEPHGLSSATIYAAMGLVPEALALPLRPLRPAEERGLYEEWARAQGPDQVATKRSTD